MATEYYVRYEFGKNSMLGPLPADRIVIAAGMLRDLARVLSHKPSFTPIPKQIELYVRKDGRAFCMSYEDFHQVFSENRLKHARKGEEGLLEAIAELHFQDRERVEDN